LKITPGRRVEKDKKHTTENEKKKKNKKRHPFPQSHEKRSYSSSKNPSCSQPESLLSQADNSLKRVLLRRF
jgi:hypothetical protein